MKYQVIVGNIGSVLDTNKLKTAVECFKEYRTQSLNQYGRAGGEDVCIMCNGEPMANHDYTGTNNALYDD